MKIPIQTIRPEKAMSYETAPATKMLATHCGICGRSLVDAQSVETGIGPHCREKYMVAEAISESARKEGNRIVHRIAQIHKPKSEAEKQELRQALAKLQELGMIKVAKRIQKRLGRRLATKERKMQKIRIRKQGNRIIVSTPYVPGFVQDSKRVPGRWWHRQEKVNSFPVEKKREVYNLLRKHFAGAPADGPKGAFTV